MEDYTVATELDPFSDIQKMTKGSITVQFKVGQGHYGEGNIQLEFYST